MNRRWATALLLLAAGAALAVAYLLPPRVGHPVTPFMESAAEDATGRGAPGVVSDAYQPAVVVFVLPGCPCSEALAPHISQLHRAYGARAAFIDVVAGDDRAVAEWRQGRPVPYPVTADADGRTAREFGATRSAYTALVVNGKIARLWPGYSAGMLRELGALLAAATAVPEQPLDVGAAPGRLTSGCRLDR